MPSMNSLYTFAAAAIVASFLPSTEAHMSMWHPSMYGFSNGYEPVTPLAGKSFNQWWFHGYANDRPSEVMSIRPGQNLKIEIACSKSYSTYGNSPSADGCPGDAGSFHAGGSTGSNSGWGGNSDSNLMGCALAIAPTRNAASTRPEDFTVMSIQENCVRQRDTNFAIPNNLPNCPDGECTCAWFWQGKNSAAEMYMIGFRCKVENGQATAFPNPAAPRRGGSISGPTQPMYWANDNSNLNYNPGWDDRPSYNSRFGWVNGAQTSAFGAATGNNNGGNDGNNGNAPSSSSTTSTAAATGNNNNGGNNNNDAPSSSTTTTRRNRQSSSSTTATASATTTQIGNQFNAAPQSSESTTSTTASDAATTTASPTAAAGTGQPAVAPSPSPSPAAPTGKPHKSCKRRRSRSHNHI